MVGQDFQKDGFCMPTAETKNPLTLEQEAYFLYLTSRWSHVLVLPDNSMYGFDDLESAQRFVRCVRDFKNTEVSHDISN